MSLISRTDLRLSSLMASRILLTSCSLRPRRPVRDLSSSPSLNFLCQPNTRLLDTLESPFCINLRVSVGVMFGLTQYLMTQRCSIFYAVAMKSCLISVYGIKAQQLNKRRQNTDEVTAINPVAIHS